MDIVEVSGTSRGLEVVFSVVGVAADQEVLSE